MCGESDVSSDFLMGESTDSGARACLSPSECSAFSHQKSLDTLQILQNKEETLRVQGESLQMAERQIDSLVTKNTQLQKQLQHTTEELLSLQSKRICRCTHHETITEHSQEVETQKEFIKYLQDHISTIEEMYRDCFLEAAKQEDVIDTLRISNLDIRNMERNKTKEIHRLQSVVNSQQLSLNKCQNIAEEVNHLRSEIGGYLNNSNNDSGVWERCEEYVSQEIVDDVRDITLQLHHLQTVLRDDQAETDLILEQGKELMQQVEELTDRVVMLETAVTEKDHQIKEQRKVIRTLQDENSYYDKSLRDRNKELSLLRSQLNDFSNREESLISQLTSARQHCAQLEDSYRGMVSSAKVLQGELHSATRGGADVCAESRRVLAVLREWAAHIRTRDKEQTRTIKEKDKIIKCLRHKLLEDNDSELSLRLPRQRQYDTKPVRVNETEACCSGSCRDKPSAKRELPTEKGRGRKTKAFSHNISERERRRNERLARCQVECTWPDHSSSTPEPPLFYRDHNIPTRDMSLSSELELRVRNMQQALSARQHKHRYFI